MPYIQSSSVFEDLPDSFGDAFMRQWLCSCAVFPGLRFALTMQLGQRLAEAFGMVDKPGEAEAMALFGLPWFRKGRIPQDVRLALIGALDTRHLPLVRQVIEQVMHAALNEEPEPGAPEDFKKPKSGWQRRFSGFLLTRLPENRQHDVIYRQFMLGDRPGKLDLVIDDWSRRVAGEGLSRWIDRRTLIGAGIALAATALAALSLPIWQTSEELAQNREIETEITYFRDCTDCPEMAVLPVGRFVMGSPIDEPDRENDEGPRRTVAFAEPFAIGVHEVTFEQYDAFAEATKRELPDDQGWGRGGRPVINVSAEDARAYAAWLGETTRRECRLPSEAEWEFACRAGTTTPHAFGDELTADLANVDLSIGKTTAVGNYPANAFGLFDMHGNVLEWVEDCWNNSYSGAPTDGSAWKSGNCGVAVLRGGSWYFTRDNARCAYRNNLVTDSRYYIVGFRVACSSHIFSDTGR